VDLAGKTVVLVTETCRLAATLTPPATAVSMHPGIISTALPHAMFSVGGDSPAHAAENLRYVATRDGDNGTYYDEREPAAPNPQATDPRTQQRL
jgi:hypothetical protein